MTIIKGSVILLIMGLLTSSLLTACTHEYKIGHLKYGAYTRNDLMIEISETSTTIYFSFLDDAILYDGSHFHPTIYGISKSKCSFIDEGMTINVDISTF